MEATSDEKAPSFGDCSSGRVSGNNPPVEKPPQSFGLVVHINAVYTGERYK
jgi:hypothetical protein